ncbi:MAG: ferrichrome ABC transporter permease, partial [Myxococcota bacterium]
MAIHAVTLFLGAFLLFQVQPLIGKLLLPGFGGASSVWMACLMFFQTVLLGGYAYAHLLASRLGPRAQGWTHASLLALMLPLLPLEPSAAGAPELVGESPTLSVLIVLATSVGVPFFLLSATSPLLQLWFARLYPGRSPYRLYATSNCGSLLALLTYPVWVEPNVSLRNQAWTWSLGVVVLICLLWYCAAAARRSGVAQTLEAAAPPSRIEQMVWLVLAATGSALLLGTTNQLSQNVAPVPFLWILPLALYLLTFILCFESDRFYSREVLGWMLVSSILGTVVALIPGTGLGLWRKIPLQTRARSHSPLAGPSALFLSS